MKHLRGARFFLYHLSFAGLGAILASLVSGAILYHHPSLETAKAGLPATIPAHLFSSVPSLCLAALAGLLAWLLTVPCAAYLSDHSRAAAGRRRVFVVISLMPLSLCALLFFLPFQGAAPSLSLVLLTVYAVFIGFGAGLFAAPAVALGFALPAQEDERVTLAASQSAFLALGGLTGLAVVPGFFTAFPDLGLDGSFQTAYLILIILSSICLAGAFFAVREKTPPPAVAPLRMKESLFPACFRSVREIIRFRPLRRLLGVEAASFFAFWLLAGSLYFAGRDLMLIDEEIIRTIVIIFLGATALAQAGVVIISRRLGVKKLFLYGAAAFTIALILLAFTGLTPQSDGLRWNCATAAAQSADGSVWIGTQRGASRLSGKTWTQITRDQGLIDDRITSLVASGPGMWFGTRAGASYYDGKLWTHFSQASGLVDNRVLDIIPQGNAVWFLTPVGVSLLEDAQWHQYAPDLPPPNGEKPVLTCFALDRRGALWVGTTAGLFRMDENGWTPYTTGNGLSDDTITSLAVDTNGTVYIGTYKGVALFSATGEWSHLTADNGLPDNAVRTIRIAPDGTLYVATARGVYMGKNNVIRVLSRADGLVHDRVTDILFARDRSVWFVTGNGVSVLSHGRFLSYQYSFPLIWGLVVILLLSLPAAILISLPRVMEAQAVEAYREKTGAAREAGASVEALSFSLPLLVRGAALLAAGLVLLVMVIGAEASIENSLPVRLLIGAAAAAAGTGAVLFYVTFTYAKGKRTRSRRQTP